ncbi:MFS transporter [Spongiibacter sp. KMU-158]|uniref:MFS transporter n=1 Tax=Spongiibacter pelagi TaxID=2760804 RepID=A0A927C3Y6_9GAMM|nr:MFS transporter [Spongiibacter pelagi]MBD2859151.1 MFS transporter [Spongiibacter pelagi]
MQTPESAKTAPAENVKSPGGRYFKLSLYLAMMAIGAGQTVVFAVLPMLGRALALDELVIELPALNFSYQPRELAITLLSALTALAFSISAPKWGRLSDRLGKRKSIILVGLVGHSLGSLLFCSVAWAGMVGWLSGVFFYFLLVLSRALHASVLAATHPSISAYMVDVTTLAERTKGIVKLQSFNQLGVMLGPILAWYVHISYLAPLLIHAVITLFVAMLVWWYLPESTIARSPGIAADDDAERNTTPPGKASYFDPRYRELLLTAFLLFSLVSLVQQTLGFYFQDRLHLDGVKAAQYFSLSMVASSVAMVIGQLTVVRFFHSFPLRLVVIGMPLLITSFAVLAVSHSFAGLMTGMGVFGLAMGLNGAGLNATATFLVKPEEQGSLAGMVGAVIGMGFVSGPLLGGFLYGIQDYAPYVFACVLGVLLWLKVAHLERGLRDYFKEQLKTG